MLEQVVQHLIPLEYKHMHEIRDFSCLSSSPRRHNDGNKFGGIIQTSDGKYLMVKGRRSNKWGFAKGQLESDETPLECVCREVLEETGITIVPHPMKCMELPVATYYHFWFPYEETPVPRDIGEIEEARWVSLAEAKGLSMNIDAVTYFKGLW
jgi:8-oxo-dGTP pyrophosphatase MutT (NUDIX family)